MNIVIMLAVWIVGVVIMIYPTYSALWGVDAALGKKTEDKVFTVYLALLFSALWPIILIGLIMYLVSHRIWVGHWVPKWLSMAIKRTPQDA